MDKPKLPQALSLLSLASLALAFVPAGISAEALRIEALTDVQDNAFTVDLPPRIVLRVDAGAGEGWDGLIRVVHFDWITEEEIESVLDGLEGRQDEISFEPEIPYGIHTFTFRAGESAEARLNVAYAPARRASEVPDHFPLGTHAIGDAPILPGFKWYRQFYHWARVQPEPDVWNWGAIDRRFEEIKDYGGRMVLVSDGNPRWTTDKPDLNRAIYGSQWAPDDWDDMRNYVRAIVDRYEDGSGTLAVLEAWNEPNAEHRWADTPENLVKVHRIFHEETRRTDGRMRVAGLTISPGHHLDYVERLIDLGILDYSEILAGHFYEVMGSIQRETPINNMPMHVQLLRNPMVREGKLLPIWNTETGSGGGLREEGRLRSQQEINERHEADERWNPEEPWRVGGWRRISERRMAAQAVTSRVALMSENVVKHFSFHPNWYRRDGTLVLPWVSQMVFGDVLMRVDFRYVMPFSIERVGGGENTAARAYRIGKWDEENVIVLWAFQSDVKHGRSDRWVAWQNPVPMTFRTESEEVVVYDMYWRERQVVKANEHGHITIEAGEEPVYVWGLTSPANP